jgi:hypothetical protein
MASTISINFATPEEVFSLSPPTKKSISAKVLYDILGGGVVGGGYVQKSGDNMTGFLTLTSSPPEEPHHAASKLYVDQRSFTRRFRFTVGNALNIGDTEIKGFDDYGNWLQFFNADDQLSNQVIHRFVDVYRNGILQVWGPGEDFEFINIEQDQSDFALRQIFPHTVKLTSPAVSGTIVQVNIGNVGAMPAIVGVSSLTAFKPGDPRGVGRGSGIRVRRTDGYTAEFPGAVDDQLMGDLALSAAPEDFAAIASEVASPTRNSVVLTPANMIHYPMTPKAFALFRRRIDPGTGLPWERIRATDRYGFEADGVFQFVKGYNIRDLRSGVGTDVPETLTCRLTAGVFSNANYHPVINVSVRDGDGLFDQHCVPFVLNTTKNANEFKFTVLNFGFVPPNNIDEIGIAVY